MHTGSDGGRGSSERSKRRIFHSQNGFIENKMNLILIIVVGLIVIIAGYEGYKYFGPKAPPRYELLRTANNLLSAVGPIREQVEANADFRETEKLYTQPKTGTISEIDFKHVVGAMTGRPDTRTNNIQKAVSSYQATWDADNKKIGESIEALGKKYTGGGKDAQLVLDATKTYYKLCQDFSDYALHPEREKLLHFYVGNYLTKKSNVQKGYKLYVNALKSWKVSENGSMEEEWRKALRVADDNMAKF